ncbi:MULTISPECIES: hypothetical protein [Acinetobacter]|jgi:hypothetical protein|uniref:hypothetical protein n=1 Tax=Acinetobacter TaxID=469 RepID=UPI0002CDD500|nr:MULTISPECIES: hypothetical protein [Acinetobacter]ENU59593.1 hypothetical protein F981_01691 [Acinetobacter guillouiae CIP 63.46]EPH33162.1 hypothetical protein L291_2939 [Acinetobacter guillouiae MSP4-18]KAB0627828.1 hypothetical protein F7P82_07600 [Acinetobacter guillouiae]KQW97530.1 hypothetical protein ASC84_20890 [Acinetobacter sp. Root1280]MCU4491324.1 hypothetical protein [Acinetobacter guillouiae]
MSMKKVTVHKMFEEFHQYPIVQYIGEYDERSNLINVYNSFNQKLSRIFGTYQWAQIGTDDIFFIEEDPMYRSFLD